MEESDSEINSEDRHQPSDAQNGFAANRGIDDRPGQWWTSPNTRTAVTATAISPGTTIKRDGLSECPTLIRSFVTVRPSPDSLADLSARPEQNGSDTLR